MGDYEEIVEGGTNRRFYYLGGNVLYKKQTSQPDSVFYLFTDHLGSVVAIVDQNGSEKFRATYDAWGNQTVTRNDIGFHRGYTGHEMLPEFGLINMNGRLYDPQIGRFLSTDNYVQEPWNSQNFNRYSYCLNNPLKYSDSSGELFGVDDILAAINPPSHTLQWYRLISKPPNILHRKRRHVDSTSKHFSQLLPIRMSFSSSLSLDGRQLKRYIASMQEVVDSLDLLFFYLFCRLSFVIKKNNVILRSIP